MDIPAAGDRKLQPRRQEDDQAWPREACRRLTGYRSGAGAPAAAIAHLEETYARFNSEYPLEFSFLDDSFDRMYQAEKTIGSLAFSFTVMAIIISGLGLIGLAAYTAERKKKEISVRKTLGASVSGLVTMMCREFVAISLIAAVIGCPIAWYLMDQFLEGYAYHTTLGVAPFLITAGCVLV